MLEFAKKNAFKGVLLLNNLFVILLYSMSSRKLSISDYASIREIFYYIDFGIIVTLFGFQITIYRLSRENFRKYIYQIILFHVFLVFIYSIIVSEVFNFRGEISFLVGIILINTINQFLISGIVIFELTTKILKILVTQVVCLIFFSFYLFFGEISAIKVMIIRICYFAIPVLFYLLLLLNNKAIEFRFSNGIRKYILDSAPIFLSTFIGAIALFFDKFLAAEVLSTRDFAIYSNGMFDIPFVGTIITSQTLVLLPKLNEFFILKKFNDFNESLARVFKDGFTVNIIFFILVFINAEIIVEVLYGKKYNESSIVLSVFSVGMLIRNISYTHVISIIGMSWSVIFRMLLELIATITLSYIISHFYGMYGLVVSQLIVLYFISIPFNFLLFSKATGFSVKKLYQDKTVVIQIVLLMVVFLIKTNQSLFSWKILIFITTALVLTVFLQSKYTLFKSKS